ncbi:hypothetical protein I316_07762 [Kwoniella heveanensis BCC8398]|uniref:RING-type E3 ubiquitin transferase n=1 Tax=Kwoniella heveanensis BCC8398 TaxID=1296120 RepID=A0A1B9GHZ3_9TREE|nr:hypothetical protein I316_07762 [Kwoniella heveanensis BCC8398]
MQVNVTSKSQPSGQVTAEDASITLWEYVGMSAQKWLRGDENSAVTYVLRGQILSISLAAVLIGLILLREWITQHNWQEHTRPQIVEEGEINPDEWIVMNGIARKTSEVVAAFLRADRGDRTDRVGPARGGGMWATPAPAPAPDDERDRRRTFVELAAEQREVRIQRTQGTLKAAKAALDNAQMRIGESANEEGLSELINQVQMLQDKHDRLSADVREIFTGVRTPEIGSSGSDLPLPATDEELANEASSITKALAEYRAAHRRAEQRRADIGTSTSFDGQTDNDSSGDWNPPPPLTHNRGWLDRISSHVADESVNEEIRFDGEAEAGPSRPRLERVGTGLEGMESAPMDTKSESKRGQRENEGVAYTAPEMLKNKGKGKAADSDEDGVEAGSSRTAVNEGDIPLFLPSSPAPTATPASSTRSTAFSDQPVDIREDVPMLDHTHPEADKPRLAFDGLQDLLNDVPVKDGEVEDDEGEWEDEPEEERTEHGHVEQHAHEGEDEAAIDPIFRALEAANIQNGQQIVFGVGDIDENGRININPGPARRPVEVDFVNPEELDEEPWDRDDWNGILEVIGLIGPLSGLLQNVIFGIIIMGASISIFIGIPTFIGKLALSIDPIRSTLSVISRTLYLIRKVTDPIIDVVIEIVKEVVVLPFLSSVGAAEKIVARNLGLDSIGSSANLFSKLSTLLSSASTAAPTSSSSEVASSTYVGLLGDGLAWVGQHAYDFYSTYLEAKHSVASSRSVTGRIWCAAAGYSVVGAAVAVVALVGESGGGMSREVAKTIKEHSMFFKLAFFMLLELGAFPLGIGMMMDACTVPLWPGATLVGRLDRLRAAPFGVMFVDWLIGTMFMYQFATLLSHIRTLCRPGTLFFIRDPADPNYSPVKDIVEKSALSQLRKLSTSAIMYSVIVFTLFGGASWTLAYLPYINPFPLRIDPSFGPLTSIPFDLLFLHLAVPPTIELIRPLYRLRKLLIFWWKHTISLYQLDTLISSRRPPKDYNPSARLEKVWPILDPIYQVLLGKYDNKSTKARVPASDQVILLPPAQRKLEGGVFIALSDSGTPLNPEDKLRLLKQDKRAREAGRDPKADYQVITLPIYWRTRIHTFIASTLLMGAVVIAAGALGPVVVGRMALYGVGKERGVHDGYAWLAGAYVLYFSLSLGLSARRTIVTLNKAARSRRSGLSARIKRTLRRYLASIYGVVMVYGVTPVFVGVIAELYSSPFKGRKGMMILHFWDAWAMGTVICSLAVGLATSMARFRPARASFLDSVKERFHHPAPRDFATTNRVVVPALGYLAIPLLAPFFVAFVTVIASGGRYEPVVYHGMLQAIIPLLLRIFGAGILRNYFMNGWSSMRQTMIDAEYVVEERVENYEPGKEKEQEKGKGKEGENEDAASAGADGGLGIDDDGVGDNAEAAEAEEAEAEDDEWVDEDDGEDADDADETENPDEGE